VEILSSRTILRPRDYEVTLAFYRDVLGLAIAREYPGGTVFFAGQGLIEVTSHGGDEFESRFSGALWMQVRNLADAETELVRAEVPIVREARKEAWGLLEMWIADPDDVPIVLVQIPEDHPIRRDLR